MSQRDYKTDPVVRELTRLLMGTTVVVVLALSGCGADGDPPPPNEPPPTGCQTLDQQLENTLAAVDDGALEPLAEVIDRLSTDANGDRWRDTFDLLLDLITVIPLDEVTGGEADSGAGQDGGSDTAQTFLAQLKEPLVAILDYFVEGPPERLGTIRVLSDTLTECERGDMILTLRDLLSNTGLLTVLGDLLGNDEVLNVLTSLNGQSGFAALLRTIVNAVQSPNFVFEDIANLLAFLPIDDLFQDELLDELEAWLQGESLDHLRRTLTCVESTSYGETPGLDVISFLLYDFLTLDGVNIGDLFGLFQPLLADAENSALTSLGREVLNALVDDIELRLATVDLLVFFLRDENIVPVLTGFSVLVEVGGLEELLGLVGTLVEGCGDARSMGEALGCAGGCGGCRAGPQRFYRFHRSAVISPPEAAGRADQIQ